MKKKLWEMEFKCDCTANPKCDRLVVQDFTDKDATLDMWKGKKLRGGVYLNEKSIKKLIKFLLKTII